MKRRLLLTTMLLPGVFASCCGERRKPVAKAPWEPVKPGVVFARNFMVPEDPTFRLFPQKYRLGTKAYAAPPPA